MNSSFKQAGRLLDPQKEDYLINIKFHEIAITTDDSLPACVLVVEWKRGPESQQTRPVELNDIVPDHEMNDVFSKVSSFYSKNNGKYEKKVCNFILKNVHEDVDKEK